LFYGTAGLALASIADTSIGNTIPESAIEKGLNAGWVIGIGAEHALNQAWTVKGEILHMDFGDVNGTSAGNEDYTFTDQVNVMRMGLNYKF
jgi:outer membrane immunogenic protein